MPHWRPRMNARPQMTIVEPRISTPHWRRHSPKKRKTRPPHTSPTTRAENLAITPKLAIQSRGTVSQPTGIRTQPPDTSCQKSLDHRDLRMRCQQRLGEDVV